jgi:hypothetical protein
VTATGINKAYDGTAAAAVTLSDNRLAGDILTAHYASASFADPNIGSGKTVTVTGISLTGTDSANYTLASTTAFTTADITGTYISAGGSAAIKDEGSSVYIEMDPGQDASFSVDEQTGAPVQGFAGMGPGTGKGLEKTFNIFTGAPDGSFIALVELHYTHTELAASGLNEDDLRLYYWDAAARLWKLAPTGNTAGTARWLGDAALPQPPLDPAADLGKYGLDPAGNSVWAVVDYAADFGIGYGAEHKIQPVVGGEVVPVNKTGIVILWPAIILVMIASGLFFRPGRRSHWKS